MKRPHDTPQVYVDSVEGKLRPLLDQVRRLLQELAPDVPETIMYGMLNYAGIASLAAQKNYVALYVRPAIVDLHRDHLDGLDCGRSCIRLKRSAHVEKPVLRMILQDAIRTPAPT